MVLEPIRFRYSTESLVEETPAEPEQESAERPPKPRRNDRRRQRAPRAEDGKKSEDGKQTGRGYGMRLFCAHPQFPLYRCCSASSLP